MSRNYFTQLAIAIDQFANTLLAGYADETLSSRAYRCRSYNKRWAFARRAIDAIFFWQPKHCMNAYVSEVFRKQYPDGFLDEKSSLPTQP